MHLWPSSIELITQRQDKEVKERQSGSGQHYTADFRYPKMLQVSQHSDADNEPKHWVF